MLGRSLPRNLKRAAPLLLSFLLGYLLKCLDSPPEQLSGLEQDLPLFVGPSLTLLVLVISSPGNSAVRDVIRWEGRVWPGSGGPPSSGTRG